jgi:hypothetical protein
MKKVGIIIFVITLAVGVVVASLFSFGRTTSRFFNFSIDVGSVKGSGQMGSAVRDLEGFSAVDVGGVFEVEITSQQHFEVEIEADENLLPFISTEVVNGTLKIETEKRLKTSNPIRIRISAPNINNLDVSGVASVILNDVNNDRLTIDSSGASKLKVTGETSTLNADVSGATKIDAEGLTVKNASIDASGASHVSVNVTEGLNAEASGASRILYSGSPTSISKDVSGAGSVSAQ